MRTRLLTAALALLATLAWRAASAEFVLEAPQASEVVRNNVLAHLTLDDLPCDTPGWRVRRLYARLAATIEPALRALGYYQPRIDKAVDRDEACWRVEVRLDPGPRVKVRRVDIQVSGEAADDPAFQAFLANAPLAEGDGLDHSVYESVKTGLQELALEGGYLDARLTRRELRVYPEQLAADIHVYLESGPRYRFGELRFAPQPLDEDLLRRYAQLAPGAPYDAGNLFEANRVLADAGYFRNVQVLPRREQAEELVVPIDVELTPLPRHSWRAGIGYQTDTGPRFRLGYQNRYLNADGHRLNVELHGSPIEQGLSADYLIPGRDPRTETFEFKAAILNENTDTVETRGAQIGGRHTVLRGDWTEVRFLEVLYEQSDVGSDSPEAFLVMPGIGWKRTYSDNPLRTARGYRLDFELRGAHESLLSTISLARVVAGAKGIYRFGDAGRVIGRVDFGWTWVDAFEDLPASLRFFAGGDRSVRGYGYQRLGPRDENGEPLGGRHLLVGSLGYEHPVKGDDWWLGAFVDGGNAFDDAFEPKFGYGAGIRWFSPVGLLRVDVAVPSDTFEDDWRIHFAFGADL